MKNRLVKYILVSLNLLIPLISFSQEIQKLAGAIGYLVNLVSTVLFFIATFFTVYKIYTKNKDLKAYQIRVSIGLIIVSCIYFLIIISTFDLWHYLIYYCAIALPLLYVLLNNNNRLNVRFFGFLGLMLFLMLQFQSEYPLISILAFISSIVTSTCYLLKYQKFSINKSLMIISAYGLIPFVLFINHNYISSIGYALYEFNHIFINATLSTILFYFFIVNLIALLTYLFFDTFCYD